MYWLVLLILLPYLLLIFHIYRGLSSISKFSTGSQPSGFVSVVIPCRNEERLLPRLLECLNRQGFDRSKFEVIVVNDNSTDNTTGVALSFNSNYNLRIVSNSGIGKKQAIRAGIKEAKGELIVTCDADCLFPSGWLETIAAFHATYKPSMIICPVKLANNVGFAPWFQELEFMSLQAITAGTAQNGNPVMCNGANLAFTKSIYNKYANNLYDNIPSGDDIFLLHNIKRNKVEKILWLESPEAVATTESSSTIDSFLVQRARWTSKAGRYNDIYTQFLALSTLIAVIMQVTLLFMGLNEPIFLKAFLAAFLVKSVPDYLLLSNVTKRQRQEHLMKWFLPVQFFYPYYVLAVVVKSLFRGRNWDSAIR